MHQPRLFFICSLSFHPPAFQLTCRREQNHWLMSHCLRAASISCSPPTPLALTSKRLTPRLTCGDLLTLLSLLMHYKLITFCHGTNLSNLFFLTSTKIIMMSGVITAPLVKPQYAWKLGWCCSTLVFFAVMQQSVKKGENLCTAWIYCIDKKAMQ